MHSQNDGEDQIVKMLGGDEQLYDMWKSFLKHNHWMSATTEGWSVTEKEKMWSKRVFSAGTF